VGATFTQTVGLTNTGTGSLTISAATVTGSGFSISGLTLPLTLTLGQSTTFSVTFAPTTTNCPSTPCNLTGAVTLTSNASNSPTSISLSGTGILGASLTWDAPMLTAIASSNGAVRSGNVVTITTTSAHGFIAQQTVTVSGVSNNTFNGTFVVATVPSATTFTYAQTGSDAASGGGGVVVPALMGYNVFRGTITGGPYSKLNASLIPVTPAAGCAGTGGCYLDTTIQSGVTYFYVITTVGINGTESVFSNQAQKP